MGSAQRCQLHRRVISVSLGGAGSGGSSGGGGSGSCGGGGGSRGGGGSADSWYWEEAWDRMPLNLRVRIGCFFVVQETRGERGGSVPVLSPWGLRLFSSYPLLFTCDRVRISYVWLISRYMYVDVLL